MDQRLIRRINRKKEELDSFRPLPASVLKRLEEDISLQWIYNSNAIEGSTISLKETRLILETGITIGGKSLREHFEVINHREAIEYVEEFVQKDLMISSFNVRELHKLILSKIDDINAGKYRKAQVQIAGAAFTPPEAWKIDALMDDWSAWVADNEERLHPVEWATISHHRLVAIHPFVDGNGRTARLVMNLLLMMKGYPPAIILRENRAQYYSVLARADEGHPEGLENLVGKSVERSLDTYLLACRPSPYPPKSDEVLISLKEVCQETPFSQEYLSLLARLGRLEAVKRGKTWFTTRSAVKAYIDSRHKKE